MTLPSKSTTVPSAKALPITFPSKSTTVPSARTRPIILPFASYTNLGFSATPIILPFSSTIIPLALTRPIILPFSSRTYPSSSIVPITSPLGPMAYRVFTVFSSTPLAPPILAVSQKLQSSLRIALPKTGTFCDLLLALLKLASRHVIIKLFWTLPATTGIHFIVISQVSWPLNVLFLHSSLKLKPSKGGSANSTETI